jgi:hypothetical protein
MKESKESLVKSPGAFVHRFVRWFRFVSRDHYEATVDKWLAKVEAEKEQSRQELARVRQQHAKELAKVESKVASIVEKCSELYFDRYAVTMQFDPRMMSMGRMDQGELAIVAREFSRRVEHEIRTCKFVESPRERY